MTDTSMLAYLWTMLVGLATFCIANGIALLAGEEDGL